MNHPFPILKSVKPWQPLVMLCILAVMVNFLHLRMVQSELASCLHVEVPPRRFFGGIDDSGGPERIRFHAARVQVNVDSIPSNNLEVYTDGVVSKNSTTVDAPVDSAGMASNIPNKDSRKEFGDTKKWRLKPEEILVMVMSGNATVSERIPILYRLFSSFNVKIPVIVVVENDEKPMAHGNWTFVYADCPERHPAGLCCKTARGYEWVLRNRPEAKWVFRGCDDTYVHFPNMIEYLENFDPDRPWYLGDLHRRFNTSIPYADGGAGWILSREALARVVPALPKFFQKGNLVCWDDVYFGRFIYSHVSILLHQASGIHNEEAEIVPCNGGEAACGNVTLLLHSLHSFHPHQHQRRIESRPISFHTRIGKQVGDKKHSTSEDVIWQLHQAVIDVSAHVPVLVEEDMAAINS